jgi:LysM repeat protein
MADAEEIGQTRLYLQALLAQARLDIERICEPLLDVFRPLGGLVSAVVKPVTGAVESLGGKMYTAIEDAAGQTAAKAVSYFPKLAWEKAPSTVKFVSAQDVIAQADPVLEHRSGFNYGELGASVVSAVAGTSFVAVPVGNATGEAADWAGEWLGVDTSRGVAGGIRGMVSGGFGNECSTVFSNVVFDLVTTGKVSPGDWSAQGLVGGFSRSMMTGFTRGFIGKIGFPSETGSTPSEPGVSTVRNQAGELVTTAVDESGRTTVTTRTIEAEGRPASRTVGPDGSVTTRSADGVEQTSRGGYTTTTTKDGAARTTGPDGSVTVTASDGTRVTDRLGATTVATIRGDGEVTTTTTVGNRVTVRAPDGSVTTTHSDNGGVTATRATADGYTVTAHHDGSFTITDPTGRTTTEPAAGPPAVERPGSPGSAHLRPQGTPETPGASAPPGGIHLTPSDDEPHNQDLAHNKPLEPVRETREGSAMRAKKRAKEVPAHYRWPSSVIATHATAPLPYPPVAHPTPPPPGPTPTPPPADRHYIVIVQPGDTLRGIAARFGIDWHTVYSTNQAVIGTDANRLVPGEKLAIVTGSQDQAPRYIVQPGDTLDGIAMRLGIDWQAMYSANRAMIGSDANRLVPGQRLAVPKTPLP